MTQSIQFEKTRRDPLLSAQNVLYFLTNCPLSVDNRAVLCRGVEGETSIRGVSLAAISDLFDNLLSCGASSFTFWPVLFITMLVFFPNYVAVSLPKGEVSKHPCSVLRFTFWLQGLWIEIEVLHFDRV